MPERGVVLCATLDLAYLMQAYLAALSVKRFLPAVPVTLFTDMGSQPLSSASVFDSVESLTVRERFHSRWATGMFLRTEALRRTPYRRTLHIDCDARITSGEVTAIFERLERCEIAMAECEPDTSYSRFQYGRRMFNAGVIAYRLTARVDRLFEDWKKLNRYHHGLEALDELPELEYFRHIKEERAKRRLLRNDQLGLVQLLSPDFNACGVELCILDESWNARKPERRWTSGESVRINHSATHHESVCRDVLDEAFRDESGGRAEEARLLYDAVLLVTLNVAHRQSADQAENGKRWLQLLADADRTNTKTDVDRQLSVRIALHAAHGQPTHARELAEKAADSVGLRMPAGLEFPSTAILQMGPPQRKTQ